MRQIEEALHAMHAENKPNKGVAEEKSGLCKLKMIVILQNIKKLISLAAIRPKPFAIVNAISPDSPAKEAVSTEV
jgi:hypothetical protein